MDLLGRGFTCCLQSDLDLCGRESIIFWGIPLWGRHAIILSLLRNRIA
jgi:hypothetical protein